MPGPDQLKVYVPDPPPTSIAISPSAKPQPEIAVTVGLIEI